MLAAAATRDWGLQQRGSESRGREASCTALQEAILARGVAYVRHVVSRMLPSSTCDTPAKCPARDSSVWLLLLRCVMTARVVCDVLLHATRMVWVVSLCVTLSSSGRGEFVFMYF